MRCVNHAEAEVTSYCQHCGKGLCTECVRKTPAGQILCEPCFLATGGDPSRAYWQAAANFVAPPPGVPNPSAAAVLGLIPGVGAMYNGQLFKGLIHVVVFAVLIAVTEHYPLVGILIGAWVLYQSFEAFHTAKARRDGVPVPDPFGLNEVGQWLNMSGIGTNPAGSGPTAPPQTAPQNPGTPGVPPAAGQGWQETPYPPAGTPPPAGATASGTTSENQAGYSWPGGYQGYTGYQDPWAPPGIPPVSPMPPVAPVPPYNWRRREPVWAVVMIVLGILFLLNSMGFVVHVFRYGWPLLLIGLGVWLIVRRAMGAQGGQQ